MPLTSKSQKNSKHIITCILNHLYSQLNSPSHPCFLRVVRTKNSSIRIFNGLFIRKFLGSWPKIRRKDVPTEEPMEAFPSNVANKPASPSPRKACWMNMNKKYRFKNTKNKKWHSIHSWWSWSHDHQHSGKSSGGLQGFPEIVDSTPPLCHHRMPIFHIGKESDTQQFPTTLFHTMKWKFAGS